MWTAANKSFQKTLTSNGHALHSSRAAFEVNEKHSIRFMGGIDSDLKFIRISVDRT